MDKHVVQITTSVLTRSMVYVQQLVKRFDGKFNNFVPYYNMDEQVFTVTFEDVNNTNKFMSLLEIVKQSYF